MLKYFSLFTFLFLSFICFPVTSAEKLSASALREDLEILKDIAIGTSPKLSEQEKLTIERIIKAKSDALAGRDLTHIEFIRFLSSFDMQTGFDEHASLSVGEDILKQFLKEPILFPIPIQIFKNRMLVNSQHADIPFASIIHSINGESVDDLLNELNSEQTTSKERELQVSFGITYWLYRGGYSTFDVEYTKISTPDELTQTTIKGVDARSWGDASNRQSVYPLDSDSLRKLINTHYYPDLNTYYLQLNSFNWDGGRDSVFGWFKGELKKFDRKFKTIFQEIEDSNAQTLVLDLRHNGGGNLNIPAILFSYLAKDPFIEDIELEIQDFDLPHSHLITHLNGEKVKHERDIKRFIKKYQREFDKTEDGYVWKLVNSKQHQPKKHTFTGNVYLLVGGRSYSASVYFTAIFKSENRGTIVGETVGGSHHFVTAGTDISYKLPNTSIQSTVPLMSVNYSADLLEKLPENKSVGRTLGIYRKT